MILDCCLRHHAQGESVCPVCFSQLGEERQELDRAREFRAAQPRESAKPLVEARALSPEAAGLSVPLSRQGLQKNPARRELFRLLGIYLPEREAKAALRRIHEYKWLESERAGFDVWEITQPNCPLRAAALHWARRHFDAFMRGCSSLGVPSAAFA